MLPAPDPPDRSATVRGLVANPATAEDNMNVQLKDITVTARDGRVSHLDQVYIRGSHVRFFIVPDMLRYGLSAALVASKEGRLIKLQECAHVQIERDERERCWIGERKGDGQ